jgi:hypothetical protein
MDGTLFSIQIKCLHLVGLYRAGLIKRPKLLNLFYLLMAVCMCTCIMAEAFFIIKNHDDVLGSSEAFGPLSTIFLTLIKLFTFLSHRESFYKLMNQIKLLAAEAQIKDSLKIKRVNQIDKVLTMFYVASSLFVIISKNSAPVISDFVKFLRGNAIAREMPWKTAFPYDSTLTPAYELSYINLVAGTYFTVFIFVSVLNAS